MVHTTCNEKSNLFFQRVTFHFSFLKTSVRYVVMVTDWHYKLETDWPFELDVHFDSTELSFLKIRIDPCKYGPRLLQQP